MATLKMGSTTVLTESGGALTINASNPTVTLGSNTTFPAGHVINVSEYNIGAGSQSSSMFPSDDTIPQRSEGAEIFSQAYSPSTGSCDLRLQAVAHIMEGSNAAGTMALGLFISDQDNAIITTSQMQVAPYYAGWQDSGTHTIDVLFASWGTSSKTFSLRSSGANLYNSHMYNSSTSSSHWGSVNTTKFFITEIAT